MSQKESICSGNDLPERRKERRQLYNEKHRKPSAVKTSIVLLAFSIKQPWLRIANVRSGSIYEVLKVITAVHWKFWRYLEAGLDPEFPFQRFLYECHRSLSSALQ